MAEAYLSGAITQAIERARQLSAVIDQRYPPAYDGLRQICSERLRLVLDHLRDLQSETIADPALQTPRRLRMYRRAVSQLRSVETIGAPALASADEDSARLSAIVRAVCDELNYPLVPPTVTNRSTSYLGIYADFNLMMAPLLEGRFLLHLPDLYHELAHPLLHARYDDHARLDPYRRAYLAALHAVETYFRDAQLAASRDRAPADFKGYLLLWEANWKTFWLEEFFCDAFAALTCGPAFGWAHLHLTAKNQGGAFETPVDRRESHPADDARFRLIMRCMKLSGFNADASSLDEKWGELIAARNDEKPPEYMQCYPEGLIDTVEAAVRLSLENMGVVVALPGGLANWTGRLNDAWAEFWRDPEGYARWEQNQLRLASQVLT
jgi:hypothetical protein